MQVDKKTVFIVDDFQDNIFLMARFLSKDFHVISASSGNEALAVLAKEPAIHLFLLDIMMPEMDGLELLQKLKQNTNYIDVPSLAVTANCDQSTIEKMSQAGFDGFVPKPVEFDRFLNVLTGRAEVDGNPIHALKPGFSQHIWVHPDSDLLYG